MAKVSLIIPTFERPHLLPRAVESALRAGREVEVIVVDDASTDETATVCARLARRRTGKKQCFPPADPAPRQ